MGSVTSAKAERILFDLCINLVHGSERIEPDVHEGVSDWFFGYSISLNALTIPLRGFQANRILTARSTSPVDR